MSIDIDKLSVAEIRTYLSATDMKPSPALLERLQSDPRRGVRDLYMVCLRRLARVQNEQQRLHAILVFERALWETGVQRVAGVDEVGVGPLAGPVVAAAVIFAPGVAISGVDDSKRLSPVRRAEIEAVIRAQALAIGIGEGSVEEIDRLNIYHASLLAMRRAVEQLPMTPQHLLVDARTIPGVAMPQDAHIQGDRLSFSIAAASIVAKVHRDRMMQRYHEQYPEYGFAQHKGYGSESHLAAIRRCGPCLLHRRSFAPVAQYDEVLARG